ncbi:MAG: molecular chaperone HtpG [Oscillospiraceae bacterium]|nr:molecular chaperone HtpG [Oscillospiraceae bacterium]
MAKKQFKAESKRLLDMMINSIYTHQEIFLRELISNASDAIDKLAYTALTDQNVGMNREDFAIDLRADKKLGLLTVSDNGIGMSRDEMEQNLGTIAKSGSLQFKQELEKGRDDVDIIGQFGVGFYSAFMVADTVTVLSRKYGEEEAWMWQSSGADGYTMSPCDKTTVGTDVILKLKPDGDDEKYSRFLEQYELQNLVKKYSDYIRWPIRMEMEKSRRKELPENEKDEDKEPEWETYTELTTLNSRIPVWLKAKKDVTDEEYDGFYKDKFFDYEKPLAHIPISVEGAVTYKALLYIPAKAPYDFYTKEYKKGLQLYSSGVMIMEHCEDLIPDYFRFVRGVVDSADLSLNISREMLQHNRQLTIISGNLEKKIKQELLNMQKDRRGDYEKFFAAFGRQLKYGVVADYGMHKDALQDLLLFWSAREQKLVTLKEYVDAMPEGQKHIYFAAGESNARLAQLPQYQRLQEKGYDVLFMTEDVDEFVPRTLMTYGEKEFRNLATDDLDLSTEEEKKAAEAAAADWKDGLDFIKTALEGKIVRAEISADLGSHPVCLIPEGGMSFEMEKYFKRMNPEMAIPVEKVLQLNPEHPVVQKLKGLISEDPEKAKQYAAVLYAQGLILADLPIEDAQAYTDLICGLL